jgi:quercetin dioxygenase-like cupin family protein
MRHMTLQEVGSEVELSHSFLSMLERGLADVSVARLNRLAEFYGIPLSELVADERLRELPHPIAPADGTLIDRGPGIDYRLLPIGRQFGIQLTHVTIAPHTGFPRLFSHDGDDFVWTLRGELILLYGDVEYAIPKGHAIWYPSNVPHALRNDKARPAEMLSVTTPPYWAQG